MGALKPIPKKNLPVIKINKEHLLEDNKLWTNRFHIKSETSNRLYVVAQNKAKRHFACSCPGYLTRRSCKHLQVLQLPCHEKPFEVKLETKE